MARILYHLYQIIIVLPLGVLATILTALTTTIGCTLGNDRFWGYYPGKYWSMIIIRLSLLPVHVVGREHLTKGQSYVFCSNHQGAFDIFLIYGFLGSNFKWMMKQSLRAIPFVGRACEAAGFIFVDHSHTSNVKHAYERARSILKDGMSLVVFPEGSRTRTGRMGAYKRGAFLIADELQLPVVPLTINGSFDVLSREENGRFLSRHALTLTIHAPLAPIGQGPENIRYLSLTAREATYEALEAKYKTE